MSKQKKIAKDYENVSDFLADIGVAKEGVANDSHDKGNKPFFWTSTYEEAEALYAKGWPEGVERVAKRREGLSAFLDAAKAAKASEFAWEVVGDFVDTGRYLSGEPECFGSTWDAGEQQSARVASIRLNTCVSASVDAKVIAARGVAVLVAVDLLESCGIRCEVIVSQGTKTHDLLLDSNIVVKRPNEVVDPDRFAFVVAHPAFFRRFGFRFMELNGHRPSWCYPCPLQDYGKREGVVEIDEILSHTGVSDEALKQNVLKIAEKCGLTFTDEQIAALASA